MARASKTRPTGRFPRGLRFGLIVIAVGLFGLFVNLGRLTEEDLWTWWPSFFVLTGLLHLLDYGLLKIWGHVQVVGGLILLAGFTGYDLQAETWWPLGLVWVGLIVVLKSLLPRIGAPRLEEPVNVCHDEPGREA